MSTNIREYNIPCSDVTIVYDAQNENDPYDVTKQPLDDIFDSGTLILGEEAGEFEGDDAEPMHAIVTLNDDVMHDLLSRFLQYLHTETDISIAINDIELDEFERLHLIDEFLKA